MSLRNFFILLISSHILACSRQEDEQLFYSVSESQSGISFSNDITTDNKVNVIDFQYCYNGGGVGVGDFNQDGLPDIYFGGNQVSSALYLNKGNLTFQDITKVSSTSTDRWITGVSIVDINADGFDDIYLNVGGPNCSGQCNNLLFINQGVTDGIPHFEEKAASYGLDDGYYTQQTVFFDIDADGDLDAYLLRNGNLKFDKNSPMPKRYMPDHLSDVLLINNTDKTTGLVSFESDEEWSSKFTKGFGLGLAIDDFDNDGRPDLYAANDFISNDFLFLNQNSTLSDHSSNYLSHQTYNAMGVDIADINNDLNPDILVLDMLPFEYKRQKKMMGAMNYDKNHYYKHCID